MISNMFWIGGVRVPSSFELIDSLLPSNISTIEAFRTVLKWMGPDSTIIFDDAQNYYFTASSSSSSDVKEVIHMIENETRRIPNTFSVLFISSASSTYPERVVNLMTDIMYIKELEEEEIRTVMTTQWHVGRRVSDFLIGMDECHLHDMSQAVNELTSSITQVRGFDFERVFELSEHIALDTVVVRAVNVNAPGETKISRDINDLLTCLRHVGETV